MVLGLLITLSRKAPPALRDNSVKETKPHLKPLCCCLTKILCGFQMLQCIIGMVDKTKRAVSVLQQRCGQDREELLAWARKTAEETEAEVKRRAGMRSLSHN